jgi:hypothetical protein
VDPALEGIGFNHHGAGTHQAPFYSVGEFVPTEKSGCRTWKRNKNQGARQGKDIAHTNQFTLLS